MKDLMILFIALMVVSCISDKSELYMNPIEAETRAPAPKVDICHFDADDGTYHVIRVSANAWPAHEAHGDVMLVDGDGDGWVEAVNECVPGGDCNDSDPLINPTAIEICSDGIDNDCDGTVDVNCIPVIDFNGALYVEPLHSPGVNGRRSWNDAITYCENLVVNGLDDWYLPPADELLALYNNRLSIGGFRTQVTNNYNTLYWSSTSATSTQARARYFNNNGGQRLWNKSNSTPRCRCVRR